LFLGRKYHIERNKQAFVSKIADRISTGGDRADKIGEKEPAMYGLIAKMRAKPGKRDDLLVFS